MPIVAHYLEDGAGINSIVTGELTGQEILKSAVSIMQNENFTKVRYWIVDRTDCTKYTVSSDEMRQIAMANNEGAKINNNVLIALVSPTDLQFGMTRMYESYLDKDSFTTMTFRDRESAEEWIKSELKT